jgi:rhodanese-related sulfurtransferase
MTEGPTVPIFAGIDDLLADARTRLTRLDPGEAAREVAAGALIVDIRPAAVRLDEGEIPGSLVIERNHLEWRLDPGSSARVEQAVTGQPWIIVCSEGYTSSLAADVLNSIGVPATDVVGGFRAWQRAGFPTIAGGSPEAQTVS